VYGVGVFLFVCVVCVCLGVCGVCVCVCLSRIYSNLTSDINLYNIECHAASYEGQHLGS